MTTLHYQCDEPGYEANFVEFDRRWTRSERRAYAELQGVEWLELIQRKVVACHLECVGREPITSGAEITEYAVENAIDSVVWEWFRAVLLKFMVEMAVLGEELRRRVSGIFATTETTTETDAAENSPTNS